jgi:hypothetical protein
MMGSAVSDTLLVVFCRVVLSEYSLLAFLAMPLLQGWIGVAVDWHGWPL